MRENEGYITIFEAYKVLNLKKKLYLSPQKFGKDDLSQMSFQLDTKIVVSYFWSHQSQSSGSRTA